MRFSKGRKPLPDDPAMNPWLTVWGSHPTWYVPPDDVTNDVTNAHEIYTRIRDHPHAFIRWVWHYGESPCVKPGGKHSVMREPISSLTLEKLLTSPQLHRPRDSVCAPCLHTVFPWLSPARHGWFTWEPS